METPPLETIDFDATGIKPLGKFPIAPEGDYFVVIRDVKQSATKDKGYPLFNLTCEIDDKDWLGVKFWHNISIIPRGEKGAGIAIHFLKQISEPWEGKIKINPHNWKGRIFRAHVGVEKDFKGRDRNFIVSIDSADLDQSKAVQKPTDSEVPF